MFEVDLAHKLPELRSHEDYLTSCIFGTLKYLPPNEALFPILNKSFNYRLKSNLGDYLKSQKIKLARFNNAQILFWPRSSKYGEPDLVVMLEGISGSFLIPIEIKYYSEKHGEGEEDQLMKYYIALFTVNGRRTFINSEAIRKFRGELLAFIYLTKFEAESEIEETLQSIESRGIKDAQKKFFHLRWHDISKVVESLLSEEPTVYKRAIYEDIIKLMTFKNLLSFKCFSKLPEKLSPELLSRYPVFFASAGFRGFPEIPEALRLEYEENIFYGG